MATLRKEIMNTRRSTTRSYSYLRLSALTALWSQTAPALRQPAPPPSPLCPPTFPPPPSAISFLLMGNLAGQQAVWTASDGTLHMFFQFNDRGRGPKTTSILKLDSERYPDLGNHHRQRLPEVPRQRNVLATTAASRTGKTTPNKAKRKSPRPPTTLRSMERPRKSRLLAHAALHNGGKIALLPEGEARVAACPNSMSKPVAHRKSMWPLFHYRPRFLPNLCLARRPRQRPRKILRLSRRMGIGHSRGLGISGQAASRRAG